MLTVILLSNTPHLAAMQNQERQEVDDPVAFIFKLLPFALPGAHPLGRTGAFQCLRVGFFVHGDHDFIVCQKPF